MKLYTKEQVRKGLTTKNNIIPIDLFLEQMVPINLPSDEDIDDKMEDSSYSLEYDTGFRFGAKWVIEQIKQQDDTRR